VSFARKLDPHAVVTVVIAIAIFCIVLPLADHPAALGTMDFIIRIIDVMTRVVLTNLLLDLHMYRASVHSTPIVTFARRPLPSLPFHLNSLLAVE
jgi:hypothetical protein